MKRRNFIKSATAFSAPVFLKGFQVAAIANSSLFPIINSAPNDRVLVIVQLNGGNDGLNTIIPLDQYDKLMGVRENVMIPENKLLKVTDKVAFHPSMTGIQNLYDANKLTVLQGVGYPNQNRSHFRSKDIWTSASDADEFISTGWLGRYFDTQHPVYPEDYPNTNHPDPIAITIGSLVSETCQGVGSNFSLALRDVESLAPLSEGTGSELPDNYYGQQLGFLRNAIAQTNAYGETILSAADKGNNLSDLYPNAGQNPLADQLKIVANLISGGLQTKVYVVSLGGFDTHAGQVLGGDNTGGIHATLLEQLSTAMNAFQDDLKRLGKEEKVVGMTFSEFGRRIKSNGSLGTDHGSAAPLLLFGSCVNSSILGEDVEIPDEVGNQDGVPMQFDFRSIYGSLLVDWFGAEESDVRNYMFADFQYLPIIAGCEMSTSTLEPTPIFNQKELTLSSFPNPFTSQTTIEFEGTGDWMKLSIFDAKGAEVKVLANQSFPKGKQQIIFDGHRFPAGNYYVRLQTTRQQRTKLLVKM
ncbi:MAG: DUF1501 domain-containing protein [Bacteroidota bacterium]